LAQIQVNELYKSFRVPEREGGLGAALRSVVRRKYKQTQAVDHVSFSVEAGEIVGFLGPNGAGKTTTLKMLSGLLHPTSGSADVMGHVPWRREANYLQRMSMLMGQRTQLNWDLPAIDSFLVHAAIYRLERSAFQHTLDELTELLELGPLLKKQVRTLSLGERMKCEICSALLHRPAVLFLDEPTIGVDITMQGRIRKFIGEYNRRFGATIILTSHYMADVTALCRRIILIDHGKILFDGPLPELSARLAPYKVVTIDLTRDLDGFDFTSYGEVTTRQERKLTLRMPKESVAAATGRLLAELPVLDLSISDPPIEDVIERMYHESRERAGGAPREPAAAAAGAGTGATR